MRRLAAAALLLALATGAEAQGTLTRVAKHITTTTTTAIVAAVAGQSVYVEYASVCVDGGGATTSITWVDTGSTNLVGTSVVYALLAGQCIEFQANQLNPTGGGLGLSLTTSANGPVEVNVLARQR